MPPNNVNDPLVQRKKKEKVYPAYTYEELEKHSTPEDVWISINGKIYDVTGFVRHHPGGDLPILDLAGRDVTEPFLGFHPDSVLTSKLPPYQVGVIKDYKVSEVRQDFLNIRQAMKDEGLYDTSYAWYAMKFGVQAILFAVFLKILFLGIHHECLLLYLVSAAVLGIFWQQFAFLGHDFGHNAVTHDIDLDWYGSMIVTVFFGVSGQWWRRNHNTHHIVTNSIEHDPDIQHLPVFAISDKIFKGYYSSYYEVQKKFDTLSQILTSYQHYLFYPVMAVARINLHVQSFLLCLNMNKTVRYRAWELAALFTYMCWYFYIISLIPSNFHRFMFVFVAHAVCGILHVQICLSHFAMDTYSGAGFKLGDQKHWLECQLATSMNVDCPKYMDWFHGGLQFQTEHHLFPRLTRHNLRYAMEKYIKPYAKKHKVKHTSYDFVESNKVVMKALYDAAMLSRKFPNSSKVKNYLFPLLNADG